MLEPIKTITLANGLQIKLKEIHTAPLISSWIWYRVGSRDEIPGRTGISHWVEHLQFKGTERFPSDELEKAVSRTGGVFQNWWDMERIHLPGLDNLLRDHAS
jgi:zinc protease